MNKVVFAIGKSGENQVRSYADGNFETVKGQKVVDELFAFHMSVDEDNNCEYLQGYVAGIPVSNNKLMDNKGREVTVRFAYGPDLKLQRRQFVDGKVVHVAGNDIVRPLCVFEYRVEHDLSMKLVAGYARVSSIMVDVADHLSRELRKLGTRS